MLQPQGVLRHVGQRSPPGPNLSWQQAGKQKPHQCHKESAVAEWPNFCATLQSGWFWEAAAEPGTLPGLLHLWAYFPVRKKQQT